ncbi:MAG: nucleotidyltransferase domain-containing protein [Candidatus Firestonebacteria bacterium]|nr:nucleotidyltransferase domain-containing protein [Candidatus Firestonebacteria bacterium]
MLNREDINNVIINIKKITNPKKIFLFGSYAKGEANEYSDIDILVVDDSAKNKHQIALEISEKLFPRNYSLDLIVVSPEEIEKKQTLKLDFWIDILKNGKLLYVRQ